MHVAWAGVEVLCTPGATQDYCACGGCWGRSSSSSFRSPGAIGLLSPSTISHRSLWWQQSPRQTGLDRYVMTVAILWLRRAHCSAVPAPVPMIPAVTVVPVFSSASGDAQYLTPKVSCYWPVQRVLLMLWTPSLVLLSHPFGCLGLGLSSQSGCFPCFHCLHSPTWDGHSHLHPVCFVPCANIWVNPEGCTQDILHFLLLNWCQSHFGDKKISTGQC